MTNEQQEKMLSTQRLILNRKRLFKHYEFFIYIGLPMLVSFVGFIIIEIREGTSKLVSPAMILLALPVMGLALFFNQYRGLRFTKVNTTLSKEQNYQTAKEAIQQLKWRLKVDNKGFLEAFNPFSDIRTWGDEMISIVITDHQILINSICNVDGILSQAALSFGKNRQNIRRFCKEFNSIEQLKNS
jgi:hypothetical protein